MNQWVVVFNRIEAKFYKRISEKEPLKLLKRLEYELGRERNKAMQDSRPGRDQMHIPGSVISHSMTREKDPHEEAAVQFMRIIADELESELNKKSYGNLVLVADPHMVGLLKESLSKQTGHLIETCIHKNLMKMPETDVVSYLQKALREESIQGVANE